MSMQDTTISGCWPVPALLLAALLTGCGGVGDSGRDQAAATTQSTTVAPVERPVAKPMDRGAQRPTEIHPVDRPVAKPLDRALDDAPDRS